MKVKKVGVVSLSSGILGEDFAAHQVEIGKKRLNDMGIEVKFMENSLKGLDYLDKNPSKRAEDLINAFKDDSIDMILCAIGGEDTYRLLPYLFENDELKNVVSQKIFLGFSDTTVNHLMLYKLGIKTFYGQAFLTEVAEIDDEMLPYSKSYFKELIETGSISEIRPSDIWYDERTDFSKKAVGTKRPMHKNNGYELLQGSGKFSGEILGGCIDTIYRIISEDFKEAFDLANKYEIFPSAEDWKNKILLLETSENKPDPKLYRKMIKTLKSTGIFDVVNGVIIGKPQDNKYYDEYKKILVEEIDSDLSILYNFNVGHALPRCIVPFGVACEVDFDNEVIRFNNEK
ncbi:S66 family peptidase [Mediannikoviicoccus vaginalis]|uniref:S66 family peptidase n=1 Tax=Mediannikoviicoccus vaginalis TaxID=2899727 RepID=UPI001F3E5FBC|nr:S66 peptidase family protein [Mediannikoviicoccus vaginalis]